MELTIEKVEKLLGEATPGRWQAEQGAYNKSPWIITALTPEQPRDEDDTQGDIYLGQGYTGTNDEHLVADVFLLGPYKALYSSQANAEIMAAAPDLARLALTLHAKLHQEREGREKLVKAMRKAMGQLNNLERMVPQTELPTEIWIGLELAIRHPELPLSPLFHTPAPQAQGGDQ